MTLDTSNNISSLSSVVRVTPQGAKRVAVAGSEASPEKVVNLVVSQSSLMLDEAFQSLPLNSDVDLDKVLSVQAALSSGELKLDEDALVQAILEMSQR